MDQERIPTLKEVKKFKREELLRLHPDKYKDETDKIKNKKEEVK